MMGTREKMVGGLEYDALTRWRRYLHWRPGERKFAKRKFWKRVRAAAIRSIREKKGE